jgi:hypothetical protein
VSPREFASLCKVEKDELLALYFDREQATPVSEYVQRFQPLPDQIQALRGVLDSVLTDAFYTILLGLDGAASIGGKQVHYHLEDEEGHVLTRGLLEGEAWEAFHGK